ncbi:MAG: hypothetical protein A2Z95_02000 [Gallionellales bacterium GWA2_60_18]|nr:MAG: hypothetical protein A2Z95_02000 [Gallionellales bacterium GWA2_60_18]
MNNAALHFSPRLSPAVFGIVLAAHGLLFWALLRQQSFDLLPTQNVLSVRLLTPAAPQQPETVQPVPRPVETPQPLRKLAPQPVPVETVAPAPAAAEPVAAAPEAVAAPAAPPSETQPLFDADYLANPKPSYPALSRRLGEEGKVMLRVQVAASGLPLAVEVQAGSGSERLDRAALDAVRRWRFVPARRGSAAVAATVLVPIVFSLNG